MNVSRYNDSSLVGFAVPRKIRLATIFDSLYLMLELYMKVYDS